MDTTASPRVLVIGLDPYRVPGPWDPEPVAKAIEAGLTKFAEHGVGVETCLIGLDGSDDVEVVIGNALRAHPWKCVTVGGGLRHSDDQVGLLEQVINLIRRYAPDAAIAFNSTPDTILSLFLSRFGRADVGGFRGILGVPGAAQMRPERRSGHALPHG
ncbi:hypothetical protein [Streptomyces canus]|uniref:hypothetical protein n=1 Tax=Streptomyces canus TaxID=58343 RepID=UPI002780D8EB|nr:hypothetical protein [Streptomyces canus]MDQ1064756.1 hypothetical protein [Streptomyces canus]